MMQKRVITTAREVIDVLGGNHVVAEMLGTHHKAVANWRYSGMFPSSTYLALTAALKQRKRSAPDKLWGMRPLKDQ